MNRRAFLAVAGCALAGGASVRAQAQGPRLRFSAAADYSAARGGAGFMVIRNGLVLAETYAGGADADARFPLGAGTRAFAPLLAAALAEGGMLRLDEMASATLTEWALHPLKSLISVRGLLNGTSGLSFQDAPISTAAALALEPLAPPGDRYIEDAAPYVLLAEIARRKLERRGRMPDPAIYLMEHTLGPIGCAPVDWTRGPDGAPFFHDGAAVSARGWAQVGELIRRQGVWRAQQLVDDNAMREALWGSYAAPRAGMGVWLAAAAREGSGGNPESDLWRMDPPAPGDLAMAAGAGGQRLYIAPSENLVIVRQAIDLRPRPWSDAAFLSLVSEDL